MAFSSGNSGGPMADINVTPLVDVMLVLLIIFIITAPLMSHKVKVELPEANLIQNPDEAEKRSAPITLAVKEDGSLYWNDEPISKEALESRLSTAAQQTPQPPLNLRGDRTTKMRTINEITKIAQGQGMLDVGFVATKEKGQ
ncbi:biopolymer transporter ExbD [Xanthomonas melonis]|uniref:Biopolymer transport protein exbD1 n=1 Tax=Xanthomonas melonis TaxID=56456 RepID=A0A2S7DCB4_9XANT|nr:MULTISPECIES: biopolymer transporter ExbD [Xanthomonas]MCC4587873.1 biopolymer transporter ExbD [Xanthomonas sp. NCPPB 1067]MCC4602002.1 biopolymer transporter ExbD [Xanthomonas melonis]MCD0245363.1 biopolymer transporter ExbD [Xanthomonas melonis]MCD0258072.1 biopolymer transporter ExbD [Xanthomonas melonis]MCD0266292.1 biopolymer transporter ExbD [Xanthomonas melonis]